MKRINLPSNLVEAVSLLPVEMQGHVYTALFNYVFNEQDMSKDLTVEEQVVYRLACAILQPKIDRARKRRERKEQAAKAKPSEPKQTAAAEATPAKEPDKDAVLPVLQKGQPVGCGNVRLFAYIKRTAAGERTILTEYRDLTPGQRAYVDRHGWN